MEIVKSKYYPEARDWNEMVFSLPKIPRGEKGQPIVLRKILNAINDRVPLNTKMKFSGSTSESTLDRLCIGIRPVGLVFQEGGTWIVSPEGQRWLDTRDDLYLTAIFCANVRFVGELLGQLKEPKKMAELLRIAREEYKLSWETTSEITNRLTWFRQLGLVEFIDYQLTYCLTKKGQQFIKEITYVNPEEIIRDSDPTVDESDIPISDSAIEMCHLSPEQIKTRKPSIGYIPGSIFEVCNTLSGYIQLMYHPIDQDTIINYSEKTYGISRSSTISFIYTLLTLEMIERTTRIDYEVTELGKRWLKTKSPVDFVCILQSKVLFVFELLQELESNSLNLKELAAKAKVSYGFENENVDEVRKRINILLVAHLIQEDGPKSYSLTERGKKLLSIVPIPPKLNSIEENKNADENNGKSKMLIIDEQLTELRLASKDSSNPNRFEKAVQNAFSLLGFKADWLGGPGKTDVLLTAPSIPKYSYTVNVDAKSTQSGIVTEGQINFDTLKEHKKLHSSDYIVVVGDTFQGKRLINRATKHGVVLIDIDSLERMIRLHNEVPLQSQSYKKVFSHPGIIDIHLLKENRQKIIRHGELLKAVMDCLVEESTDPITEGFLQERDIYRTLRHKFEIPPTLEEISAILNLLASPLIACAGHTKEGYFALGSLSDATKKFNFYAQACLIE